MILNSVTVVLRIIETIAAPVEGVGHYEPLGIYASAFTYGADRKRQRYAVCGKIAADSLDRNWQRLILTHLKAHIGVLTGSPDYHYEDNTYRRTHTKNIRRAATSVRQLIVRYVRLENG